MEDIYKHTGNVEDYTNYKEALTTEITQSKRTFENKLPGNIKKLQQEFLCLCKEKTESSRLGRTTGKQQWKHNFRRVSNGRGPE